MKLWNGIGTLVASLEEDWKRQPALSMFGLDPRDEDHKEIHAHIMEVMQEWKDKAQAFLLYGSLRAEIQTLLETGRGSELLAHEVTLQQVRSDAIAYEGREKAHLADLSRKMKLLGVKPSESDRLANQAARQRATTRQLQGKNAPRGRARGRDRGARGPWGPRDRPEQVAIEGPPVAGLDGRIREEIRCYGCNRMGHVKKKDGQVNCPSWTEGATAPAAVISQVTGGGATQCPRQRGSIWVL
jgi:hypothetical protein